LVLPPLCELPLSFSLWLLLSVLLLLSLFALLLLLSIALSFSARVHRERRRTQQLTCRGPWHIACSHPVTTMTKNSSSRHQSTAAPRLPGSDQPQGGSSGSLFESLADSVSRWLGSTSGFASAFLFVVGWAACGPLFDYSANWQLFVNTGTTIVTFLVVFLLQRSQNKESRAVQLKLNEVVAALQGASNRMIGVEGLSEAELERLSAAYARLKARLADTANAASIDSALTARSTPEPESER